MSKEVKNNEFKIDNDIFAIIFSQTPVSTQIFSPNGDTIAVNTAWERLWKVKQKDILGKYNILKDQQFVERKVMPLIKKAFAGHVTHIPAIKYDLNNTIPGVTTVKERWIRAVIYPVSKISGKVTQVVMQHQDITDHVIVEEQLKQSEERFRQLLEHSADAITLVDKTGKRIYATPSRKNILGYDTTEDIGQNVFRNVHPDDILLVQKALAKIIQKPNASATMDFRVKHKSGKWVWIEATGTNLLNVPSVDAIVVNYRDITDRKLYAQKLEESQTKFKALFDADIIGIFISDLDGKFLDANNALLKMIGYTKRDLKIGKIQRDVLTPREYTTESKEAVNNLMKIGVTKPYEKIYIRKDGKKVPVLIAVARIGKTNECVGFVINVTERKKIEESNYRLAAIVTSSEDAIISKSLASIITSWNKGAEKMFGYSAKEAVGKPITITAPEELYKEEKHIISLLKQGKSIRHFQTNRIKKNGVVFPVSISVSPIKDKKGKIIGAANITRDITEEKAIEQQKNDFLSMASHELKTPLTSIKLFIDLLYREGKKQNNLPVESLSGRIREQANRLSELTNDLLDVSRIETGKLRLNMEKFALNEVVQDTIEALQATTIHHTITLLENPRIEVIADRYRIYQVLVNLLTNAIKYSSEDKPIFVKVKKIKNNATVSVQDFGIGIAKAQQAKIFDKLYQVTDPKEKTFPGLGLGLYISKEIIERHNGKLWVVSQKGKGSTFTFLLPLSRSQKT